MSRLSVVPSTRFASPGDTTAPAPPEERGVARDGVRMLVATDEGVAHAHFRDLAAYLTPGDLVVVNNSATLAAEFDAVLRGRGPVVVHAATRLDDGTWVVELRSAPDAARSVLDADSGAELDLPGGGRLTLVAPYPGHSPPRPVGATGSGGRRSADLDRSSSTWSGTDDRSPTGTSTGPTPCPPTRRSSPADPEALRCPVPQGRSPTSW